jgi:hypothetical protein
MLLRSILRTVSGLAGTVPLNRLFLATFRPVVLEKPHARLHSSNHNFLQTYVLLLRPQQQTGSTYFKPAVQVKQYLLVSTTGPSQRAALRSQ